MKTVELTLEDGVAWVAMNRPGKKNAISIDMAREVVATLDALETDRRCEVVVLTGAGESFSAGMDLKDYFRASDKATPVERDHRHGERLVLRRRLHAGRGVRPRARRREGAIRPLRDQLGHHPRGRRLQGRQHRDEPARRHVLHHDRRDLRRPSRGADGPGERGRAGQEAEAAREGPRRGPEEKNPAVLSQAKTAFRHASRMSWDDAADYLFAKSDQVIATDPERGREEGLRQFLDEKTFRPGLEPYKRRKGRK